MGKGERKIGRETKGEKIVMNSLCAYFVFFRPNRLERLYRFPQNVFLLVCAHWMLNSQEKKYREGEARGGSQRYEKQVLHNDSSFPHTKILNKLPFLNDLFLRLTNNSKPGETQWGKKDDNRSY